MYSARRPGVHSNALTVADTSILSGIGCAYKKTFFLNVKLLGSAFLLNWLSEAAVLASFRTDLHKNLHTTV